MLVGALIARGGMLLLGLRSVHKRLCPGMWDLIGGHVQAGESPAEALAREVEEEVGIRPLAAAEHSRHALPDGGTLLLFVVTDWEGGEPALRNDEHEALEWFPVKEACALPNLDPRYLPVFRSLALHSVPAHS